MATQNQINDSDLPLSGGTMTGAINMGTFGITNLANPVNAQDAATKNYVDTIATGGAALVVCATTANLNATQLGAGVGATLTNAGAQAAFSVDGVTPAALSRVLVKNQSANQNNGIYILTSAGSGITNWVLTRAIDYDTPSDINDTGIIPVQSGTVNAQTGWVNTTINVTVDTTAITYIEFNSAPLVLPVSLANGGTNANLTASNGGIFYSTASAGAILAGTATANQILMSGASTTPSWSTNTYPATDAAGDLHYASASNVISGLAIGSTGQILTVVAGLPSWATNTPAVSNLTDVAWTDFSGSVGYTGFSGTPTTTTARYKKVGRIVFIQIVMSGTSNATGFTITSLPFTSGSVQQSTGLISMTNNGATVYTANIVIQGSTTIAICQLSNNSTGWTNSGTKGIVASFFYESST
jgi:hypothetical protein